MRTQKLLLGTLLSAVFIYFIDYIWYVLLMGNFFTSSVIDREMPLFLYLIVGIVIFSFTFCYMYPKGVEGTNKTQQGMRYGVLVAFLVFVPMAFIMYSLEDRAPLSEYMVDALYRVVLMAVLGIMVAYIVTSEDKSTDGDEGSGTSGDDKDEGSGTSGDSKSADPADKDPKDSLAMGRDEGSGTSGDT
jgi:hypothetical protein